MMENPLISVLIPAYNAEKHIGKCLKSVTGQTYENIEVIVIDDGSKDRTGEVAKEAAAKDERISVIRQENQGVAATRNNLIEKAKGEFLIQVDADDYISERTVEILLSDLLNENADMAVCAHVEGDEEDFRFPGTGDFDIEVYSGESKFKKLFSENKLDLIVPWGKLYKKELFKDLKYPNGKIHEDEYLAHLLIDRAERFVYHRIPLFYYRVEKKGITKSYFSLKRLDCVPALLNRNRFFEERDSFENLKLCYIDFLKRFQYFYYGIKYHYPEKKEEIERLFSEYKNVYDKASERKMLGAKEKLMFGMFLISPGINYFLRGILGKKSIVT